MTTLGEDRLLTTKEVAGIFRVTQRTVTRWTREGLLVAVRPQPNGRMRFRESQVRELLGLEDN